MTRDRAHGAAVQEGMVTLSLLGGRGCSEPAAQAVQTPFASHYAFCYASLWPFCFVRIVLQVTQQRELTDRAVCDPFVVRCDKTGHRPGC